MPLPTGTYALVELLKMESDETLIFVNANACERMRTLMAKRLPVVASRRYARLETFRYEYFRYEYFFLRQPDFLTFASTPHDLFRNTLLKA